MRHCYLLLLSLSSALALANPEGPTPNCAPDGVAVGGYDLVSYRSESGPVPGLPELVVSHEGSDYRFSNVENRARFRSNPEAYLPVYKGWCAATLSFGKLACPNYTNYKIENGELLLFEHNGFTNGRTVWDSDPLNHRSRADQNFVELSP
ncbi:MAG: YHS domain-containing (seleno)protein [Pseudomonadales bacterium]